jgi:hypothetical protein
MRPTLGAMADDPHTGTRGATRSGRLARWLCAVPGLVTPVVLLVASISYLIQQTRLYITPPAGDAAQDVRFDPGTEIVFAALWIVGCLLLLLPPLLVALPARLRIRVAILASLLQVPALVVAVTYLDDGSALGLLMLLCSAFVPALAIARLVAQTRSPETEAMHLTSAST